MRTAFFFSIFFFSSSVAYPKSLVLHYEPAIVELKGTIEQQTFPGRYNYESIAKGDEPEKGWYLRLSQPVNVVPSKNDDPSTHSELEKNVKIMQLTFGSSLEIKEKLRDAVNSKKSVALRGQLFHRWNGHHHSRVLMSVDAVD